MQHAVFEGMSIDPASGRGVKECALCFRQHCSAQSVKGAVTIPAHDGINASSLCEGHANVLCIVSISIYVAKGMHEVGIVLGT